MNLMNHNINAFDPECYQVLSSARKSLGTRLYHASCPMETEGRGCGGGERVDIHTRRLRGSYLLSCYSDSC